MIRLPSNYIPKPDPYADLKRYTGRALDRVVGISWWLLVVFGAGSGMIGFLNFIVSLGAWTWWKRNPGSTQVSV